MSKVVIQGNASGTGNFTIAAPNSNTDRTLNLPDASGTVATTADIPSLDGISGAYTSGTALDVDSSGRVTKPYQPMFRVNPSSNLTHGTTTTKIQLNTETFDVGSNFDTSNYRFVAPVNGKYWFTYTTLIQVATGTGNYVRAWFYKNGSAYSDGLGDQGTYGSYQRLTVSDCIDLSANDYVEVYAMGAISSAFTYASYTWLTGFLLG